VSIEETQLRIQFRRIAGSSLLVIGSLLFPVVAHTAELPPPAQREINFARDIQPIFERSCLRCHGPEKPKSGFRLDNREGALAGGDNGKAIIPGDSTNSALIRVVAGTHEDVERMPPKDKGDPLTDEEISTLRAWIEQGAQWSDDAVAGAGATGLPRKASAAPAWRWIGISGDAQKFREHFWIKDGSQAGLEQFMLTDRWSNSTIRVDGRLWPGEDDFRVALRYERTDVGFIDAGVDQFAKYYDNSGGFFRAFAPPLYTLDRDLDLRVGKAWIDFGLTLPDLPKLSVGYEYQYRKGTKSTLQWGPVRTTSLPELPEVSVQRNIYPAFKEIDEKVHILKFDLTHEFAGVFAEDNFRAEFYDIKTRRNNALSVVEGQPTPAISAIVDEGHDQFRAVNALRAEKEIRPWWFVSAGYLSSTAEADATFRQTTEHATGLPVSGDFWRSHAIIFEQDSVLLNGSTRLGPWQDLVFRAGVQAEYLRQEGMGRVSHDTGNPATFLLIQPATLHANLDKHTLRESAELRFTGLPFTLIFAEARLEQEALGNFEDQIGSGLNFARDTDSSSGMQDWRVGFYSSPLRSVSFGGHFRQRNRHTDYSDRIDTTPGYPAFIRDRRIGTDEVEAKLTWRPRSWLKATLSYQIVDTDFRSDTDAITNGAPGGPLRAGMFNADVYGFNLMLTPFSRWYFSAAANYYDSRAVSSDNGLPSVAPYRGDVYSVLGSATCTISTNTELTASYTFSKADYAQDNAAAGLPLGINYDWHVVQAGVTRRFRNASVNLRYAFYRYDEPTSGGFNDYTAHAVFAALTLRWP
jgi:mono/diheme cytochrome c family protein